MREPKQLATIAIVNFNYEKFVAAAIDSALEQSYGPTEVIVVDDGSTDGSRGVISAYGDRVRRFSRTTRGKERPTMPVGWLHAANSCCFLILTMCSRGTR